MSSSNLYLDKDFTPTQWRDDVKYECYKHTDGTVRFRLKSDWTDEVWISHRIRDSHHFMEIAMAVDAVHEVGAKPCLFLGYMPYARQDKVHNPGEPHSLRMMCTLLRCMNLHKIRIFDPHSDVTAAMLPIGTKILDNSKFVSRTLDYELRGLSDLCLVAPDAGAAKKIYNLCSKIEYSGSIAIGAKVRNLSTQEIIHSSITGNVANKNCIIIDDICDGGRTFVELAKLLREKGAKSVRLIVSHGIFSYGLKDLREHIDTIYCTNSYATRTEADFLGCYQLGFDG